MHTIVVQHDVTPCLISCFEHRNGKNMNLFFPYIAGFSFTEF